MCGGGGVRKSKGGTPQKTVRAITKVVKKAWPHSTWLWVWSLSHKSIAQFYVLCYGNIVRSTTVKNYIFSDSHSHLLFTIVPCTWYTLCQWWHSSQQYPNHRQQYPKHMPVSGWSQRLFTGSPRLSVRCSIFTCPQIAGEAECFRKPQTLVVTHWRWKSLFRMAKCNAWLNANDSLTRLNGAKSLLPATRNSCFVLFCFVFEQDIV